jgi:hypothetical protein
MCGPYFQKAILTASPELWLFFTVIAGLIGAGMSLIWMIGYLIFGPQLRLKRGPCPRVLEVIEVPPFL